MESGSGAERCGLWLRVDPGDMLGCRGGLGVTEDTGRACAALGLASSGADVTGVFDVKRLPGAVRTLGMPLA